jgi:hypothetical protein
MEMIVEAGLKALKVQETDMKYQTGQSAARNDAQG